jgi:hypothetical protein
LLERVLQCRLRFLDLLQVQIGNTLIETRNRELRIGLQRLLERFQPLLEELLVHVGAAQVVQAGGLNGIGL